MNGKKKKGLLKRIISLALALMLVIVMFPIVIEKVKATDTPSTVFEHMDVDSGYNVGLVAPVGATSTQLSNASIYRGYTGTQSWQQYGGIATQGFVKSKGKSDAIANRYGIPDNGLIIDSNNSNLTWQLAPFTAGTKNALQLNASNSTGTIKFSKVGCYQKMWFLAVAYYIGGSTPLTTQQLNTTENIEVTIHYTDGTTDKKEVKLPHMFCGTDTSKTVYEFVRVREDGNIQDTDNPHYLTKYSMDVDTSKLIANIDVKYLGCSDSANPTKGVVNILGFTGETYALESPTGLNISDVRENRMTASWGAVASATSYRIDIATDEHFTHMVSGFNNKEVTTTTCDITGLNPDTQYYVRVRAAVAAGQSPSSETATDRTADVHKHNGITFDKFTSTGGTLSAGNYYLTEDVTLDSNITISGTVNLCLNGHVLKGKNTSSVITVDTGATLNLYDCNDTIEHKGTVNSNYLWTWDGGADSGDTVVTGGIITGGNGSIKNTTGGGGVVVKGTFNMYGGTIAGNTASNSAHGGAVNVRSGSFVMNGGLIKYNYSNSQAGGVHVYFNSTFTMNGGTITNNYAGNGGAGVYAEGSGKVIMNNGEISYNKSNGGQGGGGVRIESNDCFTMNGGTITGNTAASSYGGGVRAYIFTMTGGTISNNTAAKDGGGINGAPTITGGTISGNTTAGNGGGIYCEVANITGGTITGNTAANGGGVYAANSSKNLTIGGTANITGNEKKDGTVQNLYLVDNKMITLDNPTTAKIGITTQSNPTVDNPIVISNVADIDYSSKFNAEVSTDYIVKYNSDKKLEIAVKKHDWTYYSSGTAFTATCDKGCIESTTHTATISLSTNSLTYTGSAVEPIVTYGTEVERTAWKDAGLVLPDDNTNSGKPEITKRYYKADDEGKKTGSALSVPKEVGKYVVEVDISYGSGEGKSATVELPYEITKASQSAPNSSDFTAEAVTMIGVKDGTIAGADSTMEYSTDGGETWTKVTGSTITGVGAGDVLIRYAETPSNLASDSITVTVPNHVHTYGDEGESRYTCSCGNIDNDKHLEVAKEAAKKAIDEEVGTDTSENVKEAAEAAKKAIDDATNLGDVSDAKEEGIEKIAELMHKNVLEELKKAAKETIDEEIGTDTSENVKKAAEAAKKAIEDATTKEEIEKATDNGINAIEAAKKVNYRHKVAKEAAKAAIDKEVGEDTTPEVLAAAEEAKAAIDAATDEKSIADAEMEGIAKIAELKHLNVLEEVKKVAKEEIDLEVGTDTSENVKEAADNAKEEIDASTTVKEVEIATENGIKAIEVAKAINAGKIHNTTKPEENFGGASVELNHSEIVEKFELTEEELVRVENGEDIAVKLEVKAQEAHNVVAAEKTEVEKMLSAGEKIGQYLDVNLFKIVGSEKSKITNTNGTITIEITIPSEIKNAGKDFYIVRVHNGVAEKLALTHVLGDTYSFETDRFSTYAIVYAEATTSAETGDASPIAVYMFMMGLAGVGMLVSKKRKTVR